MTLPKDRVVPKQTRSHRDSAIELINLRMDPHNIVHENLAEREGHPLPSSTETFIHLLGEAASGKIAVEAPAPNHHQANHDFSAGSYGRIHHILVEKYATGQAASQLDRRFFNDNATPLLEQLATTLQSQAISERANALADEEGQQPEQTIEHLKAAFAKLIQATGIRESAIPLAQELGSIASRRPLRTTHPQPGY